MKDRLLVGIIAAATLAVGLTRGSTTAGGSDSYGYVSQADKWRSGQLIESNAWAEHVPWPFARWTFTPLAYVPQEDGWAFVPVYPAGLPLLMAGAKLIGGHRAVFWVGPISAAVLILATFGLAARMGSTRNGLIAALLVATSPVFLFMVGSNMSDVPVTAAWTVLFWLLLSRSPAAALGAGLAASVATLIRPNLAPMVGLVLLWFAFKIVRGDAGGRRDQARRAALFVAGWGPGIVALLIINEYLNGSPWRMGYGSLYTTYATAHVVPNIKNYAMWFVETQTPVALVGVVALLWPFKTLWPDIEDRSIVVLGGLFVIGLLAQYCVYLEFDAWWYLRFLLPCWPFIMIGLASALRAMSVRAGRIGGVAAAIVITVVGIRGVWLAADRYAFDMRRGDRKYSAAASIVAQLTDSNSVVLTMLHSGSIRYYGGRMTMRYDALNDDWLDRAVAWLSAHGAHPYALLEDWEVDQFKRQFAAQNVIGRLEMPPVVVYKGSATIYFYDLLREPGAGSTDTVVETFTDLGPAPPAAPPRLVLTK